ncbi:unnamed protein product [Arctia plantaginis]|uniref:Uncharacterized protein n=1 Tax=Arctia plantaginis TaxID=874455 RepID=A0A8S1BMA0_ARCPL|nr:unnamed protein product [Arctia plantaginis]CAB3259789.1 unnamed protein product [Arctia plantaginis]
MAGEDVDFTGHSFNMQRRYTECVKSPRDRYSDRGMEPMRVAAGAGPKCCIDSVGVAAEATSSIHHVAHQLLIEHALVY